MLTDLENRLMAEGADKLTVEVIHQKLDAHFKRLKNKQEEDTVEEKALSAIEQRSKKVISTWNSNQFLGTRRNCGKMASKL